MSSGIERAGFGDTRQEPRKGGYNGTDHMVLQLLGAYCLHRLLNLESTSTDVSRLADGGGR